MVRLRPGEGVGPGQEGPCMLYSQFHLKATIGEPLMGGMED